jgi:hypothetical protein
MESSSDYFARKFAESERKRAAIIGEVAVSAGPTDDVEWLTQLALYREGLISASELHATGSPNLLPTGWYYRYVDDNVQWCPARVLGLDEIGDDEEMAELYAQGYRWVVVFSEATGARGDRTFVRIQDFDAAAMTENPLSEADALSELADMGYRVDDLPIEVRDIGHGRAVMNRRRQVAVPTEADVPKERPDAGWFPDPAGRHEFRWWDGDMWSHYVSTRGLQSVDPPV